MASSYRTVLKEVAEGLTPEDIENMKFSLPFKTAKKATIKTGFQLLGEMEEQAMIDEDEDDLQKLQELLEQYDKKKLAKLVKKFQDSKTKKVDESKNDEKLDTVDHTDVLSPSHIIPNTQQQAMQAPPGNQYSILCTSPAQHLISQQGYPTHNIQQHYPAGNYPSNFAPGPQNQSPGMQMAQPPTQYFFPQNSAAINQSMMNNGGYPSNVYHGNQMQPPAMQASGMMPQSQYQQYSPQFQQQAPPMPQNMTQMPNQNSTPNLPNHQAPVSKPKATEMPPNIPNTPQSHRLEGQRSESLSDNEVQDVVCDTPLAFLEGLNLNDSFGSLKSVEPVAKVPVSGRREDPTAVEADGRAVNNVPASAMYVAQPESAGLPVQPASTVQSNHGNTPNQPAYTVEHSTPTQPASAMYRVRLKEATENTRSKQDGVKVTSFQQDGYELKIVTESTTRPEHYKTDKGCIVLLRWQSEYKIYVGNNQPHRCAVEVNYDGKYAGEFELRSQGNMVIERRVPPFEEGKFCFVKPESAPPGSGVTVDNLENGIITATFMPEKVSQPAYLNDLSRGIGQPEALGSDHLECYDDVSADFYESVEADAFSFNSPSYNVQAGKDVQRSIVGGGGGPPGHPSGNDWRTGATALVGHSNQQFQAADAFDVDETKKVEITLRLVGLK